MAYAKPTSVTLSGDSGIYGGAKAVVRGSSSYPYVYVGGQSTSWRYYLKGTMSGGSCTISFDADRSVTSGYKEFQILLSNTKITDGSTAGGDADSKVYYYRCPALAATIYNGTSSSQVYDSYNDSNLASALYKSGWTVEGLATSASSSYDPYNASWITNKNGNTFYCVYSKPASSSNSTCYYYRGSSTRNSVTKTTTTSKQWLYGRGTTSGGTTSVSLGSMTTTCASNSSYSLQGWATSSSSTTVRYSSAKDAYEDGYTTIYGVYRKSASSSNSTCYYYRGSGTRNSVTKTAPTAAA